jgi:bifunctional non-homologous end joining protein LigD
VYTKIHEDCEKRLATTPKIETIRVYYAEISKWILPYLVYRPLTLVRCPDNYQKCFFQKHINNTTSKSLLGFKDKSSDAVEKFIYIKDCQGLIDMVQMGILEIHSWGSTIQHIERPDIITFDLDPAPEVKWVKVVKTALRIKQYLAEYKLTSFVKTTGGKGLHVVVPISSEYKWEQVKDFCHVFVDFLVSRYPSEYIGKMSKQKQKQKQKQKNQIFIDYLRNQRGATSVAPYSTRARIHAPVSTPVFWDELTKDIRDASYTLTDLPKRLEILKKDPWQKFFTIKQLLNLK